MSKAILDAVAEYHGCFISSLRDEGYQKASIQFLLAQKVGSFSLAQWNDALQYLFGLDYKLESEKQVQEYLEGLAKKIK